MYNMGGKIEGQTLVSIYDQSLLKLFVHVLMKSITCKASNESNDIVASSTRDRNDAAVVMQINFTYLNV